MKVVELFGNPPIFHPNVDFVKDVNVDIVWDINNPIPFEDSSKDAVYISNISLLNLDFKTIDKIIQESKRILCKNGRLSIGYNDIKRTFNDFLHNEITDDLIENVKNDKLFINREWIINRCKDFELVEDTKVDDHHLIIFRKVEDINITRELFDSIRYFLDISEKQMIYLLSHEIDDISKYDNIIDYNLYSISSLINRERKEYKIKSGQFGDKIILIGGNSKLIKELINKGVNLKVYAKGIYKDYLNSLGIDVIDNLESSDKILIDMDLYQFNNNLEGDIEWIY